MRTLLIVFSGLLAFCLVGSNCSAAEKEFPYSGPKSCKKCHRKVYRSWKETPMARSFDILKPGERAEIKKEAGLDPQKDYTKDATCLPCHTTGFGKEGGFVSVETTPLLVGVSCEECHGAGSEFNKVMERHGRDYTHDQLVPVGFIPDPKTTCGKCHNEKSPTRKLQEEFNAEDHDWPGHDPVKLKYHSPEYEATKGR